MVSARKCPLEDTLSYRQVFRMKKSKRIISMLCAAAMSLSLCGGLAGCSEPEPEEVVTTSTLRVGVLTDVHVGFHSGYQQSDRLEKALLFYKHKGVDAVVICGDLQEHSATSVYIDWIEEFTDIWFRVFPDNKNNLTGERVEPLLVYGNHDVGLVRDEYWPERLGEYQDAWIKEVKGYQFVGAHYTKEGTDLTANLVSRAEAMSEGKPFFFIQHQPIVNTVLGESEGLLGAGVPAYDLLRKYNNCVALTGHTHIPITDERSIWQSDSKKGAQFTAINCGTINYAWIKSYTNMDINGNADATQQGLYMMVDGSQVRVERYSFAGMELIYEGDNTTVDISQARELGHPWIFDALQKKNKPYDYDTRYLKAFEPEFAEDAVLEIGAVTTKTINVFIPPATVQSPEGYSDLIHSYYVEAYDARTMELINTTEVASPHHIEDTEQYLGKDVFLTIEGLEPGTTYLLKAYARECYQKPSQPLTIEVTTDAE